MSTINELFENYSEEVNELLLPRLKIVFDEVEDVTCEASLYSLLAGGKRIRPCLMLCISEMLGLIRADVIDFAVALEMIHTYSLIHDDLPAMDNDDLRRGKPTCHKVYGEGIALLAGDNLLNRAAEILFDKCMSNSKAVRAASYIMHNAGIYGMIGGQSIDLSSENQKISLEKLYELQDKKTGALLKTAIVLPYIYAIDNELIEINSETERILNDLAYHLGLAFQIKDDILDVEADAEILGKSVGKDERDAKSTFVTLLGLEEAERKLNEEVAACHSAVCALSAMNYDVETLNIIVNFLLVRVN